MADYHINIFYSEEDEGYIGDIPDLKTCSAFGRTPEEALAAVEEAKSAWLEVARASHKPIPPPRYRPGIAGPGLQEVSVEELIREIGRREKRLAELVAKRDALKNQIKKLENVGIVRNRRVERRRLAKARPNL